MYIYSILPIAYIFNKFSLQSVIDLDFFSKKNSHLFDKNFNFLFDFFNSDKGKKFENQYQKPIKLEKKNIEDIIIMNFMKNIFRIEKRTH